MGRWVLLGTLGLAAVAPALPAVAAGDLARYKRPEARAAIARVVRQSIWARVRRQPMPAVHEPALAAPAGVFVTLERDGVTRACWGTVHARMPSLGQELAEVAVKVLSHDTRQRPVSADELAALEAHVSVMGELEPVSGLADLLPRRYGLLVAGHGKGGVLLPGEAATARWQIDTCKRKAGLSARERVSMYRFETAVVGPVPLSAGAPDVHR